MITLSNEYQYLGRSNGVRAYGKEYYYYILLYAKTTPDEATGRHQVSVKMRIACTNDATFYGWYTSGSVEIADAAPISWNTQKVPAKYWGDSSSLVEDGVTYRRWTDLAEGTTLIDTAYAEKEIEVSAAWQRLSVDSPPAWLPSTTEAKLSTSVILPAITNPNPAPEPAPEPDDGDLPIVLPSGVQVYADDALVYDSRLESRDLAGLVITTGLNVGGTAEIVMESDHPAYNSFVSYKTIVTIYRAGVLLFRGRALYTAENFTRQRTVTCEGELCFLRDTINRPYLYEASPRSCFVTIIGAHNKATDPEKMFLVGDVTVTDPNDYIRLESESAETTLDTLNKLIDRCGGYLKFTTNDEGRRVIHWLASLDTRSGQAIEFGENLFDFSSTGANTTNLATGLVPYGARDIETKKRVTIESVNGGKDYILAEDAQAVRGTIFATVSWDDVTEPANLLKKAREYLDANKVFITSLDLTALDLSYLDKDLDSFTVGDMIHVRSLPHGIDEDFQLTKKTEDLLNPADSQVTLGKELQSLTGADVGGDNKSQHEIEAIKVSYKADVDSIAATVEATVLGKTATIYVPQDTLTALVARLDEADSDLQTAINTEANARAGVINKVSGVVHISGGAPINMLGGKIDINGSEINFGKEIRFLNGSGIRIADKDGNYYYMLRVDDANSCVVGSDYTNLYLRGKDAVYLYKTGAVVTSDRREKNSVEELPEAYTAMLDKLTPVRFRYNGRGDKYHVGFVAQDVEDAMTEAGMSPEDFGGFVDLKGDGTELGLAYDEFIGLLLEKIRRLEKRIETLEEKA